MMEIPIVSITLSDKTSVAVSCSNYAALLFLNIVDYLADRYTYSPIDVYGDTVAAMESDANSIIHSAIQKGDIDFDNHTVGVYIEQDYAAIKSAYKHYLGIY